MNRLDSICSLIPADSIVCDIGCDHAYLLLKLYPKIKKGFACDIAIKPLNAAKKTILENNISDKITTILSNGLENIQKISFNSLVIAGMGGELISSILENCDYIKDNKYQILLQPMSKSSELRKYLYENGFSIVNELISIEDRRVYTILNVKYTGIVKIKNLVDCFVSTALTKDKNFNSFLDFHLNRIEIIINNMKNSDNISNFNYYTDVLQILKEYKND